MFVSSDIDSVLSIYQYHGVNITEYQLKKEKKNLSRLVLAQWRNSQCASLQPTQAARGGAIVL